MGFLLVRIKVANINSRPSKSRVTVVDSTVVQKPNQGTYRKIACPAQRWGYIFRAAFTATAAQVCAPKLWIFFPAKKYQQPIFLKFQFAGLSMHNAILLQTFSLVFIVV
jgi:hypothetical protein